MKLGIETLIASLRRKRTFPRIALLSHQAAILSNGMTTAQALHATLGKNLVALFAPEHGFFGLAGAGVRLPQERHGEWGIPIFSLYGEHRKPTPEMLHGIDVVIVDFQDLAARCYTYIATLRRMLEAAAESNVAVIVADRPVPLPDTVDGPMLDDALRCFVADAPVPMAYGMTPGETALWLQKECLRRKFHATDKNVYATLDLTVIPCTGYRRPMTAAAIRASFSEWIPPSPGIRSLESAQTYLCTVFTEAMPAVDCGRATALAFRVLGFPDMDAPALCGRLGEPSLPGVTFHPHRYTATGGRYDGQTLDGIRITVTDPLRFKPVTTSLHLMKAIRDQRPETSARTPFLDSLYGTASTRHALDNNTPLPRHWNHRAFLSSRNRILLY